MGSSHTTARVNRFSFMLISTVNILDGMQEGHVRGMFIVYTHTHARLDDRDGNDSFERHQQLLVEIFHKINATFYKRRRRKLIYTNV
jgi:hypothetical protein